MSDPIYEAALQEQIDARGREQELQDKLIVNLRRQVQYLEDIKKQREMENEWRYAEIKRLQKLLIDYIANVVDHEGVAFLDGNNYTFNLSPVAKAELRMYEHKARELLNK